MRELEPGDEVDDPLAPYLAFDRRPGSGTCWVMANMVGGLDGSAAIGGRVGALSGCADAELFRLMRALADVVVVGAETVRREKYGPVRLPPERERARLDLGKPRVPPIAVVSRSLLLDWDAPLFTEAPPDARTIVVTCAAAEHTDPERVAAARKAGEVIIAGDETVELATALLGLHDHGARIVLCEGGPTLLGELVERDLLDELCLTLAPIMGGDPLPVSVAPDGASPRRFTLATTLEHESTLFLRYLRGEA